MLALLFNGVSVVVVVVVVVELVELEDCTFALPLKVDCIANFTFSKFSRSLSDLLAPLDLAVFGCGWDSKAWTR